MADHHLGVRVEVYEEPPESELEQACLEREMDRYDEFWSSPAGRAELEQLRLERMMDVAAAREASPAWQADVAAELERQRLERMMDEADAADEYRAAEERRRQADAARRTTCPAVRVRQHGVAARPRERRARSTRRTSASASASDSSDPPPARLTRASFRKDTKLKLEDFAARLEGVVA
jgi:hypothetical protein